MNADGENHLTAANGDAGQRYCLWTPEFAADPHRAYEKMRRSHESLVPVELAPGVPATLVIGYRVAVQILHDSQRFPADPSVWETGVPSDCPVLPMMRARPNAIRSAGRLHERYRSAIVDAVKRVDLHRAGQTVERIAVTAINAFCANGTSDIVEQFALPVTFGTLNALLGCPPEISERAAVGIAAMFDSAADAVSGSEVLEGALMDLVAAKRVIPGDDITTWLVQHPTELSDDEVMHQLVLLYAAGISPPLNLIVNTLLLMVTDDRFGGGVLDGSLSLRDALDEVLFNDPPMANYCLTYPRQPMLIQGEWLPENQPVLISMAACNTDPRIRAGDSELGGSRAHLAFSAGPHACPAQSIGYMTAQFALGQLLDALPDLRLAVPKSELLWRPGPFHRALTALPIEFDPSPPIRSISNP